MSRLNFCFEPFLCYDFLFVFSFSKFPLFSVAHSIRQGVKGFLHCDRSIQEKRLMGHHLEGAGGGLAGLLYRRIGYSF